MKICLHGEGKQFVSVTLDGRALQKDNMYVEWYSCNIIFLCGYLIRIDGEIAGFDNFE